MHKFVRVLDKYDFDCIFIKSLNFSSGRSIEVGDEVQSQGRQCSLTCSENIDVDCNQSHREQTCNNEQGACSQSCDESKCMQTYNQGTGLKLALTNNEQGACCLKCKSGKCTQTCNNKKGTCFLECNGQECTQTCNNEQGTCSLKCNRGKCTQTCNKGNCGLECDRPNCEQTCNNKQGTCCSKCNGLECMQTCKNEQGMCSLKCNRRKCTQTCKKVNCGLECNGKEYKQTYFRDCNLKCHRESCKQLCNINLNQVPCPVAGHASQCQQNCQNGGSQCTKTFITITEAPTTISEQYHTWTGEWSNAPAVASTHLTKGRAEERMKEVPLLFPSFFLTFLLTFAKRGANLD